MQPFNVVRRYKREQDAKRICGRMNAAHRRPAGIIYTMRKEGGYTVIYPRKL